MPTYEYVCRKCGHEFEQFQRITDAPLKRCPTCRGAVRRKIGTGAALLFKGSGFYITDYRSENYKKGATADSSGTSKPAKSANDKKTA
jgi:putative FmdB family regulatory protein